jgi:hypothetical protein
MGSPSDGCEEFISSWRYLIGYLHGEDTRLHTIFIFGLQSQEVSLVPQAGAESMICQDGLLLVVPYFFEMKI